MKIIVPIKRVADHAVRVRIKPDGSGVELASIKMSLNPFDEIAVEEAVRLKEKGLASEVVAVSVGPQEAVDAIRSALAIGADRGILVKTSGETEPQAIAKILKKICDDEKPDLVLAGKQAIDGDAGQTGLRLAALLGWGQATRARALKIDGDKAVVECEADNGLLTVAVKLPAVITTDLRLNEPRYASLPNIMKARKKTVEEKSAADFGIDMTPSLTVLGVTEPPDRPVGVKVSTVPELLDKLQEAGVI